MTGQSMVGATGIEPVTPTAPTYPPMWQQFLRQLWPGEEDGKRARLTLQEIFGLMLTPDTRYQKIFLIVGRSAPVRVPSRAC
jgi:phage/plasmid-associated DNA primase